MSQKPRMMVDSIVEESSSLDNYNYKEEIVNPDKSSIGRISKSIHLFVFMFFNFEKFSSDRKVGELAHLYTFNHTHTNIF